MLAQRWGLEITTSVTNIILAGLQTERVILTAGLPIFLPS